MIVSFLLYTGSESSSSEGSDSDSESLSIQRHSSSRAYSPVLSNGSGQTADIIHAESSEKGNVSITHAPPSGQENVSGPSGQIKEILGEDWAEVKPGPPANEDLANRWSVILKKGLDKTVRKEIAEKYPYSENCPALQAPKLNHEAISCLNDSNIRQDKFFCSFQNQIGVCVSAIALALNGSIANQEEDRSNELRLLIDSTQLLSDVHHTVSVHRRFLIMNHLDPSVRKVMEESPIDDYLFGEDLAARIKNNQEIKKAGAELQLKANVRYSTLKVQSQGSNHLNWKRQPQKGRKRKEGGSSSRKYEGERTFKKGRNQERKSMPKSISDRRQYRQ